MQISVILNGREIEKDKDVVLLIGTLKEKGKTTTFLVISAN